MRALGSNEEVLNELAKMGLTGGGEEVQDSSVWDTLLDKQCVATVHGLLYRRPCIHHLAQRIKDNRTQEHSP